MLLLSQIPVYYRSVLRSWAQNVAIGPRQGTYPALMPLISSDELLSLRVPDVDHTCVGTSGEILPTKPRPSHRSHHIVRLRVVVEHRYTGALSRPYVDTSRKSYGQIVRITPVDEVEVEVVAELRGVKDLKRYLWYLASLLVLQHLEIIFISSQEQVVIEWWHSIVGFKFKARKYSLLLIFVEFLTK